jgi:hypothetical protein
MSLSIAAQRPSCRRTMLGLLALALATGCFKQVDPIKSPDAARPAPVEAGNPPAGRPADPPRPPEAKPPEGPRPPSGPRPPDEPDRPITAAERAQVVDALTAALVHDYVFADKAAAIDRALHGRLKRGEYGKVATVQAFVKTVTEDMAAIAHDKHLAIEYSERPIEPFDDHPSPGLEAEEAAEQRYLNHGVFEVRRMKFNIGYLNFNIFGRPAGAGDKLAAAMVLLHDTQSLIVDLRECRGGDTDTVTLAESYLLPANTHILDLHTRATNVTEHAIAKATLAGPRYDADKPVFVLIGEGTRSGCEAFAYAMQSHKRATVIGGHSAGAAYFGGPRRLTEHFMAFIPIGRPIDPITRGDWEGVGVIPAVAAAPGKALDVAERKSIEALLPREPSRRRKESMQKRMAELD